MHALVSHVEGSGISGKGATGGILPTAQRERKRRGARETFCERARVVQTLEPKPLHSRSQSALGYDYGSFKKRLGSPNSCESLPFAPLWLPVSFCVLLTLPIKRSSCNEFFLNAIHRSLYSEDFFLIDRLLFLSLLIITVIVFFRPPG